MLMMQASMKATMSMSKIPTKQQKSRHPYRCFSHRRRLASSEIALEAPAIICLGDDLERLDDLVLMVFMGWLCLSVSTLRR